MIYGKKLCFFIYTQQNWPLKEEWVPRDLLRQPVKKYEEKKVTRCVPWLKKLLFSQIRSADYCREHCVRFFLYEDPEYPANLHT